MPSPPPLPLLLPPCLPSSASQPPAEAHFPTEHCLKYPPPRPPIGRLLSEYMELAPASLVADAAENLAGEPLLHMVHTKVGLAGQRGDWRWKKGAEGPSTAAGSWVGPQPACTARAALLYCVCVYQGATLFFSLQEGAKAACMVLAYGTAKDRKKALKAFKVSC